MKKNCWFYNVVFWINRSGYQLKNKYQFSQCSFFRDYKQNKIILQKIS
jgi:hypothetical protein